MFIHVINRRIDRYHRTDSIDYELISIIVDYLHNRFYRRLNSACAKYTDLFGIAEYFVHLSQFSCLTFKFLRPFLFVSRQALAFTIVVPGLSDQLSLRL